MGIKKFDTEVEMLRLAFDEEEKTEYSKRKVEINKKMGALMREARKKAKLEKCYVCGKTCSSFCNSHSVPQFCLRNIAENGKVYFSGIQQDLPFFGEDSGINKAGTFLLICNDCDSKLFSEYENPDSYSCIPSGKMLAQIALKNSLQIISKRLQERALFSLGDEISPINHDFFAHKQEIIDLDLQEYIPDYQRAKQAASGGHDDWYYLCLYRKLDYVVPFAAQSKITLISDFEDKVVNDIYNLSPDYHTKDIHVAIFPLESSSVVMLFIDSRDKRYRKFYRQLKKLEPDDQLAAVNYIVHAYTENVFLSKKINEKALRDPFFRDVCQKAGDFLSSNPFASDALPTAVREFSLSNRNSIPNLLSREYALSP